jgi:hypothetical protein
VEHHRLEHELHQLRVRSTSPLAGVPRTAVAFDGYAGVRAVAFLDHDDHEPLELDRIEPGDRRSVQGHARRRQPLVRQGPGGDQHVRPAVDDGAGAERRTGRPGRLDGLRRGARATSHATGSSGVIAWRAFS